MLSCVAPVCVIEWNNFQDSEILQHVSLDGKLHQHPYEHHALEGLLAIVKTFEDHEYQAIDESMKAIFQYYKNGKTPPVQMEIEYRNLKNYLFALNKRVAGYKSTLVDITDDDEAMALMNLTQLENNPLLYKYVDDFQLIAYTDGLIV